MTQGKKELLIFLSVSFGLPFLMGIPMGIYHHIGWDVSAFAGAQMFYPAAGLMLAKLVCQKDDPLLPKSFFLGFLMLTGVAILNAFTFGSVQLLLAGGTLVLGFLYIGMEKKENLESYGLKSKNWDLSVRLLILYMVLGVAQSVLFTFTSEGISSGLTVVKNNFFTQETWMNLLLLPLVFVLGFTSVLGEEYGWRWYFQPFLQKRVGLIKGVLLFGLLWELWHLPVLLFYYWAEVSHMSLAQILFFRLISTSAIAIFMAYAYMRTENVWLPALIHLVHNNWVSGLLSVDSDAWITVIIAAIITMVLFLPFLFTKTFRERGGST